MAAKMLSGESIECRDSHETEEDFNRLYVSDSEDESFTEIDVDRQNRLQKARELIYNDSDDENDRQATFESKNSTKESNMFDLLKNRTKPMHQDQDELNDDHNSAPVFDSEEFNSQVIRQRLAELDDSDNDPDNEIGIIFENSSFIVGINNIT